MKIHVQTFYTNTVGVYIMFLICTQGQCKYLSNTLTQPHVSALGCGSVYNNVFIKSPCLWASFHPQTPSFSVS